MDVQKILHMTSGEGEFSYTLNSSNSLRTFNNMIKPILGMAIKSQLLVLSCDNVTPCKVVLNVADFGCGVGPTPVAVILTVREMVDRICKEFNFDKAQIPDIQMYMNDLPSNDFNLLFKENLEGLNIINDNDDMPFCYVFGAPGSFYNRLFGRNTLHLAHSNFALQWLSRVPLGGCNEPRTTENQGNIVATETSPQEVVKAYSSQFQRDFTSFLRFRSQELVPNGHMVLSILCRPFMVPWQPHNLKCLSQALTSLVLKGMIKKEKLECFNMPNYVPCKEEIQEIVLFEGSFTIGHIELVYESTKEEIVEHQERAKTLAKILRSFTGPLISHHFGASVWQGLHAEVEQTILDHLGSNKGAMDRFNIFISLRRNMD